MHRLARLIQPPFRAAALASLLMASLSGAVPAQSKPQALRFVVITKLSHPWFDAVRSGAQQAAAMIERQSGAAVVIDYRPPAQADPALQAEILEAEIRSQPTGITIDLLDGERLRPLLERARRQGIAINVFDSEAPSGAAITSIGTDFCRQARIAAQRLVQLLGGQGEVAIMQGVPTAPNHAIRVRCHREVFAQHPGIRVVAAPIDHDSIETAEQEARATMGRHPQLRGWVVADAGGGIGIGRAVAALGRTGGVQVVALDDLPEQLQLIQDGVVDSSAASKPRSQGYWAVVSLWQENLGAPPIDRIDTGIAVQTAPGQRRQRAIE